MWNFHDIFDIITDCTCCSHSIPQLSQLLTNNPKNLIPVHRDVVTRWAEKNNLIVLLGSQEVEPNMPIDAYGILHDMIETSSEHHRFSFRQLVP